MLMDSGAAAVVGALLDPFVGRSLRPLVVNVGNFHVLGFRLRRGKSEGVYRVEGLFEHHTGFLDQGRLEDLLERLANGKLTNEEVFGSQGHGALVYDRQPLHLGGKESPVAVVGPRRDLMLGSRLHPFLAAPYGDMMLAGDYGLIRTAADQFADIRGEILHVLADPIQVAPWDVPRE